MLELRLGILTLIKLSQHLFIEGSVFKKAKMTLLLGVFRSFKFFF